MWRWSSYPLSFVQMRVNNQTKDINHDFLDTL